MPLRSSLSRKRLLVHLSQAVETLSLRKARGSHVMLLGGVLDGNVRVQFLEVSGREFAHFENLSDALVRLDKGTYGRCVFCGGRIEAGVLTEMPWATECLGCGSQESQP